MRRIATPFVRTKKILDRVELAVGQARSSCLANDGLWDERGSKLVVLDEDSILAWFGVSLTDRRSAWVETGRMAFGWDASPVDYRDDELDLTDDGDDPRAADLDDLRDLDD